MTFTFKTKLRVYTVKDIDWRSPKGYSYEAVTWKILSFDLELSVMLIRILFSELLFFVHIREFF